MRLGRLALTAFFIAALTLPSAAQSVCGEPVTLPAHDGQSVAYAFAPADPAAGPPTGALVLLAGGDGAIDLDASGCVRKQAGNSLVRSRVLFAAAGFATALVDAPSDMRGPDGLGGFRTDPRHAEDIGRVVVDLRRRTGGPVFVVGTSRGTISAANAAARLTGDAAPDAVVLTSPVTSGNPRGRKAWVAQSVFDLDLAAIRVPVLVVSHASDTCVRTPPDRAPAILDRTAGEREQFVSVTGGPAADTVFEGHKACEGRAPHGFVGQEAEVAAGIVRFLRGGA